MDTMKDTKMQPAKDAVINELRMLAEDLYVNGYNRYSLAMLTAADRLEAAENDSARHKALAESALRVAKGWEDKCDALRAKIEAMERQVPICLAEDLRYAENLLPALGLMPEDKLYALPGAKGGEK